MPAWEAVMAGTGPDLRERREAFYQRISGAHLTPLWEVLHELVPERPTPRCAPAHWRYAEVRPHVLESGALISAREATRRVLILENPGLRGQSRITGSLYGGLQLLAPGEVAPAHRHTQAALRFVLEGRGAYTAVQGERALMEPGDLVLTPAWTWHDHGSEGGDPTIWLDGLDIPLHAFLDTGFREDLGADEQQLSRPAGDALARYGANMLPVDFRAAGRASPLFVYPYARSRDALSRMSRGSPPDPCHAFKLRYANPVTGGHALPTMSAFLQLLPAGFTTAPYRSTDATVLVPFEGRGRSHVGGQVFEWSARDVLVVPSWAVARHEALEESVIFSYSDRAVQEQLGAWREHRGA
jgi:gentisate 1,2-dioxygenase